MRGWITPMRFIERICRCMIGNISRRTTIVIRMIATP